MRPLQQDINFIPHLPLPHIIPISVMVMEFGGWVIEPGCSGMGSGGKAEYDRVEHAGESACQVAGRIVTDRVGAESHLRLSSIWAAVRIMDFRIGHARDYVGHCRAFRGLIAMKPAGEGGG